MSRLGLPVQNVLILITQNPSCPISGPRELRLSLQRWLLKVSHRKVLICHPGRQELCRNYKNPSIWSPVVDLDFDHPSLFVGDRGLDVERVLGAIGDLDQPLRVNVELFQSFGDGLDRGVADGDRELHEVSDPEGVVSCSEVPECQDAVVVLGLRCTIFKKTSTSN